MTEFGVPIDVDYSRIGLREPEEVWSRLVARELRPEYEIDCGTTEEGVRSFLLMHLGHLDGQDVALSVAGSRESEKWKVYSEFDLRRLLDALIGDQTNEFTEFMVVGLLDQKYLSVQQEEYFTGIFAVEWGGAAKE